MIIFARDAKNKLEKLQGWKPENSCIRKTFVFGSFLESIKFVNSVSGIAEKLQHHPDIKINYTNVEISTTTHSEKGLTEKDFLLARQIEDACNKMKK